MTRSDDLKVDPAGARSGVDIDCVIGNVDIAHTGCARNSQELTVLLVDNSDKIRRSASRFLSTAGYSLISAADGFDALAKVVEYRPVMVLVDIAIPRLDGYQTCALIKNNADFRHIPVVMLSSKDGLYDTAKARVVGSDAHLSKPFTADTLISCVLRYTNAPTATTLLACEAREPDLDTVD